ncbi:hypothetical protein R3I93_007889 [Phoxinus phoxinus]|uniref:SH3 domain-containing protein n=1 Tax=Phoxinus phoxinus TaxID=58324 RepID=A0AAN9HB28_9TELE
MNSQGSYGSNFMFQSMNDELNATLATADELSREFSSLLSEATPVAPTTTAQSSSAKPQGSSNGNSGLYSANKNGSENIRTSYPISQSSDFTINRKESNLDLPPALAIRSPSPGLDSMKFMPSSPSPLTQQHAPFMTRKDSDSRYPADQKMPPNMSPNTLRQMPQRSQERSTRGSLSYVELSPVPSPTYDSMTSRSLLQPSSSPKSSMNRSQRQDRAPSPQPFNQPSASTLPRNFQPFRSEEGMQRQKKPWNETDLDVHERKPHHTYDQNEWTRPAVPNSNWKESNLDGPPSAKKDTASHSLPPSYSSLPRNARVPVPPDLPSNPSSAYSSQQIINRIAVPPPCSEVRQQKSIPLSFIMKIQHPGSYNYIPGPMGEPQPGFQQHPPLPREYLRPNQSPQPQQAQRQPPYYREVLHPGDVDAELSMKPDGEAKVEDFEMPPRPLSPTRLQPVVAPQSEMDTDLDEVMRIRAEFPRALKRRGSAEVPQPLHDQPISQPNPYKMMMNKLFRRKTIRIKEEPVAESASSSDGEESPKSAVTINPIPITEILVSPEQKGTPRVHSILRKGSKGNKSSIRRAHLSPLVLMLDGSLVGELETVQRAAQEMSDPSQSNDEGITALHNAICGGHSQVVEFLVRIGANLSAPDSHGWTPLHCAASCNERILCEFLVRNGAAVMAVTDSDGATASQKCDPYAQGFEECEGFLRGAEEAMGVENSGVVYALWGYPAQAPDELSFREGDMVTILQKPDGVAWWWASLCGREGFVPNNYFGLFPKVRPKTLC